MANDIAGIKSKLETLLEAVTGIDKAYSYGIKDITKHTAADIWWAGVREFIPETNVTYKVGWLFEITIFIKAMDRKNADTKLASVLFSVYQKLWENPDLDFADYVDSIELLEATNGETNEFRDPYVYAMIPLIVYTEETRTG